MEKITFIITVITLCVMLIMLYFKSKDVEELNKRLSKLEIEIHLQSERINLLAQRVEMLKQCYERLYEINKPTEAKEKQQFQSLHIPTPFFKNENKY